MNDLRPVLTIIIEAPSQIDKESTLYRRILSGRIRSAESYQIKILDEELTTGKLKDLCETVLSSYIIVVNQHHHISKSYISTMLERLHGQPEPLIEPYKYQSAIPSDVQRTVLDDQYFYKYDFDIHGMAFNTKGLSDMLDAMPDIDRTSIYVAYRLFWSLNTASRVPVGYSTGSDANAGFGYRPVDSPTRLLPLINTDSNEIRCHILRMMVLFLRGLRDHSTTNIPLSHLRSIVRRFGIVGKLELATQMNPFECAWIKWLADPEGRSQKFKDLTKHELHLTFRTVEPRNQLEIVDTYLNNPYATDTNLDTEVIDAPVNTIRLGTETLCISRTYHERKQAPTTPDEYNFYARPITSDSTILFFDRPFQADDNAEYLYDHFRTSRPNYEHAYFALNPKSPDWRRLESKGFKLVKMFSKDFYEMFLRSDLVVSSQIFNLRYRGKSFANSRFVYLQHGIQMNDMTSWVVSKHFDLFVATGKNEAKYLSSVAPLETINSGLPRLESLKSNETNSDQLLFMPTWRFNLNQATPEDFRSSKYFEAINAILTNTQLLEHLEDSDSYLNVKLHPNVEKRAHHFEFSSRVRHTHDSYRNAISTASFVFTDYSSAVLDASYISKPIAYYQWDHSDFFEHQLYKHRIDYNTGGLGPVFYEAAPLIDYISTKEYLEPNAEYQKRRLEFFDGVETERINETIIERMLSL